MAFTYNSSCIFYWRLSCSMRVNWKTGPSRQVNQSIMSACCHLQTDRRISAVWCSMRGCVGTFLPRLQAQLGAHFTGLHPFFRQWKREGGFAPFRWFQTLCVLNRRLCLHVRGRAERRPRPAASIITGSLSNGKPRVR